MTNQEVIEQTSTIMAPGHSIKNRLLIMSLGLTVVAVIVITSIAIVSARAVSSRAQQVSSEALRDQASNYLVQITQGRARETDLLLEQSALDVLSVIDTTAATFNDRERLLNAPLWSFEDHMYLGPDGQYMNGENDITSVQVPNTVAVDQNVIDDIELGGYLEQYLAAVFNNNQNVEAIYFATPHSVTRYYPNINLGEVLPPDFQVTERVWYTGSVNPSKGQRLPWWTPVYVDATGLGLVTTVAGPVYDASGNEVGVIGFDITLEEIRSNIENYRFLESGYSFLVDDSGSAIALPEQGFHHILGRSPEENETGAGLKNAPTAFGPVIAKMMAGENGITSVIIDGEELFVAYIPLNITGWSLGSVVSASEVLQSINTLQGELSKTTGSLLWTGILPLTGILLVVLIILGLMFTNRLVSPIQALAEAAQQVGQGNWEVEIPVGGDDEIGLLGRTFKQMVSQLQNVFANLEKRVTDRTQALEQRTNQIRIATEVARDLGKTSSLDTLLTNSVHLIQERFGYYHVAIFLLDETKSAAHLVAAAGHSAEERLNNQKKVEITTGSHAGWVLSQGQARIATEAELSSEGSKDPNLPGAHSSIALPLRAGGAVIGMVDIYGRSPGMFDEQDAAVLQTLADQVASEIEKSRLVEKLEKTVKETSASIGSQVRETWQMTANRLEETAFEYDHIRTRPLHGSAISIENPEALESLRHGKVVVLPALTEGNTVKKPTVLVPLMIRSQMIGVIGMEKDDLGYIWSEDEIAVLQATANQAALTLENARLIEETRRQAAREQLTGEITARIRQTLDVEAVLQATVVEVQKAIGAPEVIIHLVDPEIESPQSALHQQKTPDDRGNGHKPPSNSHGGNGHQTAGSK